MKKTITIIGVGIAIVGIILLVGGYVWATQQLKPIDPAVTDLETFVVEPGTSVTAIANQLVEAELIRSPLVFRVFARYREIDGQLQAGTYQLSPAMSLGQIATELTSGKDEAGRITILEGWRREEVAGYLAQQDFSNYDETEFLTLTEDLEGKLFPDTYLVADQVTTAEIVQLLTQTFEQKVIIPYIDQFEASTLSEDEVITLASIVEREARDYEDMRHIAGILLQRLNIGMALQADATMQYANGYDEQDGTWWVTPRPGHRQIVSPYNTYQQPGLPPGPIANPGLNAIRAVLDPNPTDDLFYIHTSSGESYYARTLEEHNANINRYLR